MKIIRSIGRHFRDAFRNLFRNGWMTTASILVMTVTLFMIGLLVLVFGNIQQLTMSVEQEIQVRVLIDPLAETSDEQILGEEIAEIEEVTRVVYRSAEEELESYQEVITEDFDVLSENNPLNNMYLVNVINPQNIENVSEQISAMDFVLSANVGALEIDGLIRAIELSRYVIAFLATAFVIIAVLLVSNTIRATIKAREAEIDIMRLVGARKNYIRAPFIIEGGLIGIIGAVLASFSLYSSYEGLLGLARNILAFNTQLALAAWPTVFWLGILLLLLGIILGTIAAGRPIKQLLEE